MSCCSPRRKLEEARLEDARVAHLLDAEPKQPVADKSVPLTSSKQAEAACKSAEAVDAFSLSFVRKVLARCA